MQQTVAGETRPISMNIDADALRLFDETRASIALRSALVWAEHCSECVMPSCYSTCAFYTPRRDLRCRRFDQGLEPVRSPGRAETLGMRVSFRKWGKLEAVGRPSPLSNARFAALAKADATIAGLLAATPLPHRLQDGASIAWNRAKTRLASKGEMGAAFDAFLIECLGQSPSDCVFTLSVKPETSTGRYFQRHFTVKPGYNRIEIPVSDIEREVDLKHEVMVQIEPVEAPEDNAFLFGCVEFVAFTDDHKQKLAAKRAAVTPAPAPAAKEAKPAAKIKCVVWDLDNTLWRGTLIEDGIDNLVLNPVAVAAIKELDKRGILHSVASKNNPEDALAALERFGLREYFLAPQIGWTPKSGAIGEIARRLNIHKNTFLFIDDQPFERAEVQTAHPDVRVVAETEIAKLLDLPELDSPVTEEARNRRAMYKVEEMRETAFEQTDASFLDFLRSCSIELTISDVGTANIARVFELSQRTNQLNYAGKASSRKDVEDLLSGTTPGKAGLVLSCADKFGDYGVIGFAVVDTAHFHVENFFMSCRVQHKKVDHAFFAWLIGEARKHGQNTVSTVFHFSGRNQSARQVLDEMAFAPSPEAEVYVSPPLEALPAHDIVKVNDKTRFAAAAEPAIAG
jgi:FkbH-like protein